MKSRFLPLIAVLAAFTLATTARADDTYKLDAVHSQVVFRIHHIVSTPFGIFHAPTGTVTLANEEPNLDLAVDVDKVDMGNEKWASDIKGSSWFDVKQFPNVTFKSTKVSRSAERNVFDVTGDLTLHGVTKSITVTLTQTGEGKGMQGETRIGYDCTFKIKRSDYGMTTYIPVVGDEVTLMVNIEAIKQ